MIAPKQTDYQADYSAPAKPGQYEFTDLNRAAANAAFTRGKVVVIDRGPPEPVADEAVPGERTPAEIEAANTRAVLARREHDEWHKVNAEPISVEMTQIDAQHAAAADPVRYILVPRGVRAPVTLEERVALLERRLGPETPDEIAHRNERDAAYRDGTANLAQPPYPATMPTTPTPYPAARPNEPTAPIPPERSR